MRPQSLWEAMGFTDPAGVQDSIKPSPNQPPSHLLTHPTPSVSDQQLTLPVHTHSLAHSCPPPPPNTLPPTPSSSPWSPGSPISRPGQNSLCLLWALHEPTALTEESLSSGLGSAQPGLLGPRKSGGHACNFPTPTDLSQMSTEPPETPHPEMTPGWRAFPPALAR